MIAALPSIQDSLEEQRSCSLSATDLLEYCLGRIEQLDPALHAWVSVDAQGARRQAAKLDQLAADGSWAGPLHGILVAVKDIIDVQGMATEAGSPLLAGRMADEDAPVVRRLREQGAIILGKTVTTEFAFLDPGPTCNPWNPAHTPGGSSSGSAVAVAAEMCHVALGSQTGGSIIRPASYCGVAGMKPTYGRVDATGVVPLSHRLDHVGALTRTVGDLLPVWQTLGKPLSMAVELEEPPQLYLIQDYFLEQVDEGVAQVTLEAINTLQEAGATLAGLGLPPTFRQLHQMHRCIMAVDAAETHVDIFAKQQDQYGKQIRGLIEQGLSTFAIDYALALRHHKLFGEQMRATLGEDRIAVTPATMDTAPEGLAATGDPAFNSPWSYAGLPTVTVPCGSAENGLPCGLQLIAPADREDLLLQAAGWCECQLKFVGYSARSRK